LKQSSSTERPPPTAACGGVRCPAVVVVANQGDWAQLVSYCGQQAGQFAGQPFGVGPPGSVDVFCECSVSRQSQAISGVALERVLVALTTAGGGERLCIGHTHRMLIQPGTRYGRWSLNVRADWLLRADHFNAK
jgi:hypothetical protein